VAILASNFAISLITSAGGGTSVVRGDYLASLFNLAFLKIMKQHWLGDARQDSSTKNMSENLQPQPRNSSPLARRMMIYAAVVLVVFLLGFVPMWLQTRAVSNKLAETEHQLTLVRMQDNLASAVIDARRGDYEPARQAASQFYTSMRAELDKGDVSNFTKAQRDGVQPLLASRDGIITLLARSDPASVDRLADLYTAYRKIMNG
jgi:hypothetical protein